MATPRKHWFKVADSILREPISPEDRGIIVGLLAVANQRWARDGLSPEEAGQIALTPAELHLVTGRERSRAGLARLRHGLRTTSATISCETGYVLVEWPKFAEFQGLTTLEPGSSRETSAPSAYADARRRRSKIPRAPRAAPAEWSIALSRLLANELRDVPGATFPRGHCTRWAREIERLHGETPLLKLLLDPSDAIEAGIRWAFGPENQGEYAIVIRSGKSLREKWPKLVAAAQRQRQRSPEAKADAMRAAADAWEPPTAQEAR